MELKRNTRSASPCATRRMEDPYFEIDKVLEQFRRQGRHLSRAQLTNVLNEIALLALDPTFLGTTWLTPMCENIWENESSDGTWFDKYGQLTQMLYTISFLGVSKSSSVEAVYSYTQPGKIQHASEVSEGSYFEIHPAFRQALDIDYVTLE